MAGSHCCCLRCSVLSSRYQLKSLLTALIIITSWCQYVDCDYQSCQQNAASGDDRFFLYKRHCYEFSYPAMPILLAPDAQDACITQGGRLAMIENTEIWRQLRTRARALVDANMGSSVASPWLVNLIATAYNQEPTWYDGKQNTGFPLSGHDVEESLNNICQAPGSPVYYYFQDLNTLNCNTGKVNGEQLPYICQYDSPNVAEIYTKGPACSNSDVSVMKSISAIDIKKCSLFCNREPLCVSFDYFTTSAVCNLLGKTTAHSPTSFGSPIDANCKHFDAVY